MARIRTIKPEFFKHEDLFELEEQTGLPIRLAFAGLWCCCDREGRFKWRPRQLKTDILPYDDIDFSRVLDALMTRGFVVQYVCGTDVFGCVPSFKTHQIINNREATSTLPGIEEADNVEPSNDGHLDACPTRAKRDDHAALGERKGKERKGKEGERHASSNFDAARMELPPCIPVAVWQEWVAYRRKRKLTVTEPTMHKQIEALIGWNGKGHSPTAIITTSITNGWQGLFEPKTNTNQGRENIHDRRANTIAALTGYDARQQQRPENAGGELDITGVAVRVD